MSKPVVASYCTTFLKPEMRHIYRQVSGLKRWDTWIMTRERIEEERYPFPDIEVLPRVRKNFLKRFWRKYVLRLSPLLYRGELRCIVKTFERKPADLMHVYFGHTGVHLLPFIKGWNKPVVVSFHGMDIQPRPQQPGYDDMMRELLQTVPLVLARSESLFDALEKWGCPRGKMRLNRTGIPLDAFPFVKRTAPEDGRWQFVQACRLIAKKGLKSAMQAFAMFHGFQPNSRFVIAGDGPMKETLLELGRELGVAQAVELRGFLDQAALAKLYAESHVFVHPSEMTSDQNQEGVPNSMLEAMATGLPVLATRHGGIPEAVTDGASGLLCGERDPQALMEAMFRFTEHPENMLAMGEDAARSVREGFSQQRAIERLESFYDEAIAGRAPLS
jgi:colanic acid/amylovoran biosynthesis glycosyltransferase